MRMNVKTSTEVVEVKEAAAGAEVGAAAANPQFLEMEKRLDKIEKKIDLPPSTSRISWSNSGRSRRWAR
jgi:hypothetical protein